MKNQISRLFDGNTRHVRGSGRSAPNAAPSVEEPCCCVVCCPCIGQPELIFDQPSGSIYAQEVAGLRYGSGVQAGVEWAVRREDIRLFVVVTHEGCPIPGSHCAEPCVLLGAIATQLPHDALLVLADYDDGTGSVTFQPC